MKSLSKHFFFLFALVLIAGSLSAQKPSWQSYSSDRGHFKAKFPAEIKVEYETTDLGRISKANAQFNEAIYYIAYTEHTTPMVEHEEMAKVSAEAFGNQLGAVEVEAPHPWVYNGHRGAEATYSLPDKGAIIYYRCVLIGQIQYQIVVAGAEASIDAKTTKKFFKSFKYLK